MDGYVSRSRAEDDLAAVLFGNLEAIMQKNKGSLLFSVGYGQSNCV
jgi:hypothetical protein